MVRALSCSAKVVGSTPHQGTHQNQPMSVSVSGKMNQSLSPLPLSLKKTNNKLNFKKEEKFSNYTR